MVVSPTSMTYEGERWWSRIVLPGITPSAASRSMRSWNFGAMKTIRPVAPTSKVSSPVTSGRSVRWNAPQQSPGGIGFPWGQVGGWPSSVQTESVASRERMCSNSQAWSSIVLPPRSRRSWKSRSVSRWRRTTSRARASPSGARSTRSPSSRTCPAAASAARSPAWTSGPCSEAAADAARTPAAESRPSSRSVNTCSRISSCLRASGVTVRSSPCPSSVGRAAGAARRRAPSPAGTCTRRRDSRSPRSPWTSGSSDCIPAPPRRTRPRRAGRSPGAEWWRARGSPSADEPHELVHRAADGEGEREDEGEHRDAGLPASLLQDHEEVRDAGDEERDRHERDGDLDLHLPGHRPRVHGRLEHVEEPGRGVVAAQEAEDEARGGLLRQPEQPDHDRRRGALEHREAADPVERPEDERPDDEQGEGLAEVPLDPREGLHRDVAGLRHPERRQLEHEVGAPAREHLRGEPADEEHDGHDRPEEPELRRER